MLSTTSGQEYWSGLPCPPPEGLPDPGIESRSPAFQADALLSEPPRKTHKSEYIFIYAKSQLTGKDPDAAKDRRRRW